MKLPATTVPGRFSPRFPQASILMIPTFDPRPVALEGDHVILEPLALHHAADLFTAGDDPEIWRYKSILRPADLGEAEAWIADAIERGGGGAEIPFAIIHRASGRAIAAAGAPCCA